LPHKNKASPQIINKNSLCLLVAAIEFVNTTGGVNKFLFAGEEGVALGTDTNLDLRTGRLDVPNFAAGAGDSRITIGRMQIFFHFYELQKSVVDLKTLTLFAATLRQKYNIAPLCEVCKLICANYIFVSDDMCLKRYFLNIIFLTDMLPVMCSTTAALSRF
jgi:hypothetical protein